MTDKKIKIVNVYDLKWNYIRHYYMLTTNADGTVDRVGNFYHKTMCE